MRFLDENDMPYDQRERKLKIGEDQWVEYPSFIFKAGEANMMLIVFAPADRSRPPLSKIDGKPMQRIGRQNLAALMATREVG